MRVGEPQEIAHTQFIWVVDFFCACPLALPHMRSPANEIQVCHHGRQPCSRGSASRCPRVRRKTHNRRGIVGSIAIYWLRMESCPITAIDSNAIPWEERWNEHLGKMLYRKNLFEDPETGAEIRIVRYPAGVINTRHLHTCA